MVRLSSLDFRSPGHRGARIDRLGLGREGVRGSALLGDDFGGPRLAGHSAADRFARGAVVDRVVGAERGGGAIVVISSIGGLVGSRTLGAYAISKAADMQLVRNLAVEWGRSGIRANCIAPGLVKTDFAKALWDNPKSLSAALDASPLNRIGEPVQDKSIALSGPDDPRTLG